MQQHGIKHAKMPAHHAAPNGAAERLLQTTKTTLLKQVMHERVTGCKMTFKDRVKDFFLLAYRNTTSSITGKIPAEVFLRLQLHIRLSLIKSSFIRDMRSKQQKEAFLRNTQRRRAEPFIKGDKVHVKITRCEEISWEEGIIVPDVSLTTYLANVNNRTRFVHIGYLRARWATCEGPSFPACLNY